MTVKEKIIETSIATVKKRLALLDKMLKARPTLEIIDIRLKAFKIMEDHKDDAQKIVDLLKPLAQEEKRLKKLADQQRKNFIAWCDEEAKLHRELSELENEKFMMKLRNKRP